MEYQIPTVLMVEDSAPLSAVYQAYLKQEAITLIPVASGAEALRQLPQLQPDILLLDLHLPDMSGMEILQHIQASALGISTIVMTANGSLDMAVDAMRLGAHDFIAKPIDADRLRVTLHNTIEYRRLNALVSRYQNVYPRERFEGFVGASVSMQEVYQTIETAAPSRATIFITGESGTGKEVCAEAIHRLSGRNDQQFVALNCAAIPKDLMESEIFGHVKGAFTGAVSERIGAAGRANGGTLFMDEVCEMDLELQSKLLRFLQTGCFQKVGSSLTEQVDVRIICATNRNPLQEVTAGRFREDLYYRLHVIPLQLPPLRERGDDVLRIAEEFLQNFSQEEGKRFLRFSDGARRCLLDYHWPGNIRQLQNVIRQIVVLHDGLDVSLNMLPLLLRETSTPLNPSPVAAPETLVSAPVNNDSSIRPLAVVERDAILQAIAACRGNIPQASRLLEVSPSTLYRKLQGWQEQGLLPDNHK
jgi:two-component system, repressor protein LuxO